MLENVAATVKAGDLPVATVGSLAVCPPAGGPVDAIVTGNSTVLVEDKFTARVGDMTAHGGTVVLGLKSVLLGEDTASPQADALSSAARAGRPFCET